jgi:hypothetical protein
MLTFELNGILERTYLDARTMLTFELNGILERTYLEARTRARPFPYSLSDFESLRTERLVKRGDQGGDKGVSGAPDHVGMRDEELSVLKLRRKIRRSANMY